MLVSFCPFLLLSARWQPWQDTSLYSSAFCSQCFVGGQRPRKPGHTFQDTTEESPGGHFVQCVLSVAIMHSALTSRIYTCANQSILSIFLPALNIYTFIHSAAANQSKPSYHCGSLLVIREASAWLHVCKLSKFCLLRGENILQCQPP